MARQWSARCYGVARQREGSGQNSIGGSGVLSLRHFGLVLTLNPLARGCRKIWRGEGWFRPARCCSTGSGRLEVWHNRFIDFRAPALTSCITLTRARGR